jgi:hypothetical protein
MLQEQEGDASSTVPAGAMIGGGVGVLMCLLVICAFLIGRRSSKRQGRDGPGGMPTQLSSPMPVVMGAGGGGAPLTRSRSNSRRNKGAHRSPEAAGETYGSLTLGSDQTYGTVSLARGDGDYRALPGEAGGAYRAVPVGETSGGEYRAVPMDVDGSNSIYTPVGTGTMSAGSTDSLYTPISPGSLGQPPPPPPAGAYRSIPVA